MKIEDYAREYKIKWKQPKRKEMKFLITEKMNHFRPDV